MLTRFGVHSTRALCFATNGPIVTVIKGSKLSKTSDAPIVSVIKGVRNITTSPVTTKSVQNGPIVTVIKGVKETVTKVEDNVIPQVENPINEEAETAFQKVFDEEAIIDLQNARITKDYLRYLEGIAYSEGGVYSADQRKTAYNNLLIATKLYNIRATQRHNVTHTRYSNESGGDRRRKKLAFYGVTLFIVVSIVAIFAHSANLVRQSETLFADDDLGSVMDELKREEFIEKERELVEKTRSIRMAQVQAQAKEKELAKAARA